MNVQTEWFVLLRVYGDNIPTRLTRPYLSGKVSFVIKHFLMFELTDATEEY